MRFIDWFRPSYRVALEQKTCLGCSARQSHIEDLQNLLKSERVSNQALQTLLFQRAGFVQHEQQESSETQKPLRNIQTTGQLRRMAEKKEAQENPDAKKEYWARVQEQYAKSGKLPTGA